MPEVDTKLLNVRIRQRKDTLANWESANPVLYDGEIAIVVLDGGVCKQKCGDGVKTFNQLDYMHGGNELAFSYVEAETTLYITHSATPSLDVNNHTLVI